MDRDKQNLGLPGKSWSSSGLRFPKSYDQLTGAERGEKGITWKT